MKYGIVITNDRLAALPAYIQEHITVIDRDSIYSIGFYSHWSAKNPHSYMFGEDITDKDLYSVHDLWFAPNGSIYFVPQESHYVVALMLGFIGVDACERANFIHISSGNVVNYELKRVTDKQYDAIARWAESNDRPIPDKIINAG